MNVLSTVSTCRTITNKIHLTEPGFISRLLTGNQLLNNTGDTRSQSNITTFTKKVDFSYGS